MSLPITTTWSREACDSWKLEVEMVTPSESTKDASMGSGVEGNNEKVDDADDFTTTDSGTRDAEHSAGCDDEEWDDILTPQATANPRAVAKNSRVSTLKTG